MQAPPTITIVKTQAERLRFAVDQSKKSQEEVAKAAGYAGQSSLGMALSRGTEPKKVRELLEFMGVRFEWYRTGLGPMYEADVARPVRPDSVTSPLQRAVELVPWRGRNMEELPQQFAVEAPDDVMAPVIRSGCRVEIDREMTPGEGGHEDIVLLKDREGTWFLRHYMPGPNKRWEARAERPHPTMDSERDGLEVIGVVTLVHRRASS